MTDSVLATGTISCANAGLLRRSEGLPVVISFSEIGDGLENFVLVDRRNRRHFQLRRTAEDQKGLQARLEGAANVGFHCVTDHDDVVKADQGEFCQFAAGAVKHIAVGLLQDSRPAVSE